jgi:hypothetical protein
MSGVVREALTRAHGEFHTGEVICELLRFRSSALRTSVVKTVEGVRQVKPTHVMLKAKPRFPARSSTSLWRRGMAVAVLALVHQGFRREVLVAGGFVCLQAHALTVVLLRALR